LTNLLKSSTLVRPSVVSRVHPDVPTLKDVVRDVQDGLGIRLAHEADLNRREIKSTQIRLISSA